MGPVSEWSRIQQQIQVGGVEDVILVSYFGVVVACVMINDLSSMLEMSAVAWAGNVTKSVTAQWICFPWFRGHINDLYHKLH